MLVRSWYDATATLIRDRRGVAALELSLLFLFLIGLLLPIVDFGVAAVQYIGAYQALRDLGVYAQYHTPPDVTNLSGWSLPTIAGYTIAVQVKCGDADTACSSTNTASPKWFAFSTNITLSPIFLTALAGTYTVVYAERFQ